MESAPTVDSPHIAFASPTTSYSRVDTNQPEIQPTTSILLRLQYFPITIPCLLVKKMASKNLVFFVLVIIPYPKALLYYLQPPYPMNLQPSQLPAKILIGFL